MIAHLASVLSSPENIIQNQVFNKQGLVLNKGLSKL